MGFLLFTPHPGLRISHGRAWCVFWAMRAGSEGLRALTVRVGNGAAHIRFSAGDPRASVGNLLLLLCFGLNNDAIFFFMCAVSLGNTVDRSHGGGGCLCPLIPITCPPSDPHAAATAGLLVLYSALEWTSLSLSPAVPTSSSFQRERTWEPPQVQAMSGRPCSFPPRCSALVTVPPCAQP